MCEGKALRYRLSVRGETEDTAITLLLLGSKIRAETKRRIQSYTYHPATKSKKMYSIFTPTEKIKLINTSLKSCWKRDN